MSGVKGSAELASGVPVTILWNREHQSDGKETAAKATVASLQKATTLFRRTQSKKFVLRFVIRSAPPDAYHRRGIKPQPETLRLPQGDKWRAAFPTKPSASTCHGAVPRVHVTDAVLPRNDGAVRPATTWSRVVPESRSP